VAETQDFGDPVVPIQVLCVYAEEIPRREWLPR
jgi:hypothetical protein